MSISRIIDFFNNQLDQIFPTSQLADSVEASKHLELIEKTAESLEVSFEKMKIVEKEKTNAKPADDFVISPKISK